MLNMERVGRKISELRRERNMTQMELADQMGISFQAVSNWERGNSMPDISKLPELAGLFGVSIDELLGEKSELVESLTKDGGKIYLEANPITPKELSEVAPILKPDQVDEVFEKLEVSDLKEIENLLPFIGGSVVDNILLKAAESGDGRDLDIVAPFAGKDALGKAAVKLYQRFGMRGIEELIPFLSGEQREDIAELEYARNGLRHMDELYPFLSQETLQRLAGEEFEKNGLHGLEDMCPFLNKEVLAGFARRAVKKDGIKAIRDIAPFLDRDTMTKFIVEKYL